MAAINFRPNAPELAPRNFDWAQLRGPVASPQIPHDLLSRRIENALKFIRNPYLPEPITTLREWTRDGVYGRLISYPSTFGPDTHAYVLRPAGITEDLPGVLAFHCHGNLKRWGKEKIATDDTPAPGELIAYREKGYGGRAFANELARRGFTVMVPDTFMWGSRALSTTDIPDYFSEAGDLLSSHQRYSAKFPDVTTDLDLTAEMARDNYFEPEVEKLLRLCGLSTAGAVVHDDRNSLRVLRSLSGVRKDSLGAIGLSGGGNRVGLLKAVEPTLSSGVIVAMMGTYDGLVRGGDYWKHTNMLFPPTSEFIEWPDLVASAAPNDLLCLFNLHDPLFSLAGQQAAHERLGLIYKAVGAPDSYRGVFFDGHHKFDVAMQEVAFQHLESVLRR